MRTTKRAKRGRRSLAEGEEDAEVKKEEDAETLERRSRALKEATDDDHEVLAVGPCSGRRTAG